MCSHHLEVALLTVVLHQETVCVSNPDCRVQLWLLQEAFTYPHGLTGALIIQPGHINTLNHCKKCIFLPVEEAIDVEISLNKNEVDEKE